MKRRQKQKEKLQKASKNKHLQTIELMNKTGKKISKVEGETNTKKDLSKQLYD